MIKYLTFRWNRPPLKGTPIQNHSGTGSNGNEDVLNIHKALANDHRHTMQLRVMPRTLVLFICRDRVSFYTSHHSDEQCSL